MFGTGPNWSFVSLLYLHTLHTLLYTTYKVLMYVGPARQ